MLPVGYALTIVGSAVGEGYYYQLGSAVEVVLLAGIVFYAWTWPKLLGSGPADPADAERRQHTAG